MQEKSCAIDISLIYICKKNLATCARKILQFYSFGTVNFVPRKKIENIFILGVLILLESGTI